MEPCLYRQDEPRRSPGSSSGPTSPQWSPAFIGRERETLFPLPGMADEAAMEPCLYRQGERPNGSPPPWSPHHAPQWSPAFIGRESYLLREVLDLAGVPQWSPAFIGRERAREERCR